MNLSPAPLQYLRDVWQGILNELVREDRRNVKRDVAETFNGDLTVSGDLAVGGAATVTGTLTAQGLVDISGASAGQIKFPATQNASADANTLDDYEEGTFTPTLGDGTNNFTLDVANGWYTKIGNMVFVDVNARWTSIGSAGASALTAKGLSFTSRSSYQTGGSPGFFDDLDTTASLAQIMPYIGGNATQSFFYRATDNAVATVLAANSCGATGELAFSLTYRV